MERENWKDKETLERLIDAYGLQSLVDEIGGICLEKAIHIRSSYNDEVTAKTWRNAGARLMTVANSLPK